MELFLCYFLSLSTVLCNIYVMLGMCDTDTIISGTFKFGSCRVSKLSLQLDPCAGVC